MPYGPQFRMEVAQEYQMYNQHNMELPRTLDGRIDNSCPRCDRLGYDTRTPLERNEVYPTRKDYPEPIPVPIPVVADPFRRDYEVDDPHLNVKDDQYGIKVGPLLLRIDTTGMDDRRNPEDDGLHLNQSIYGVGIKPQKKLFGESWEDFHHRKL